MQAIGLPERRAGTLVALARAVEVDLPVGADPARATAALQRLPGVGPWTAPWRAYAVLHLWSAPGG